MGSKVLVTGASGFMGRRLVPRLIADGCEVRVLLLPDEPEDAVPGGERDIEIARGDVTDPESVRAAVQDVSRVYHLAAVVGDWGPEALFHRVNVEGTRHVLDAAAQVGCERVLMVSSIVVYGWQLRTGPCHEDAPRQRGMGAYGRTKRASEELTLDYHRRGRVPVTVVRPGNVYGPGSRIWVDELVARLRSGQMMYIDGGRGDADLAYVDNVVDVIARAAASARSAGRIYNAADGAGITWRQYITDLARICGAREPTRSIPLPAARAAAALMERAWRFLHKSERPLLTTEAVALLASRQPVPIARAAQELGYHPIPYGDALARVADYVHGGVV